jgi:hypothetical protein
MSFGGWHVLIDAKDECFPRALPIADGAIRQYQYLSLIEHKCISHILVMRCIGE